MSCFGKYLLRFGSSYHGDTC
uniref:Uncharacterized protein n=1 Tax=Anguilla anguilla TaxID=7936 RepID=A0A0E9XPP5_ANGAN